MYSSRDTLADRQTNRQTDKQTDTLIAILSHPYGAERKQRINVLGNKKTANGNCQESVEL